jgi:hypothetical protein
VTAEDLPQIVRQLVNRHLASMDHVEALLFLLRDREAHRRVEAVATAARLERSVAERVLSDLVGAGLAQRTEQGFRYHADPSDREAVEALKLMYDTRPVTLVRAIYARPTPVKSFADAFLFRKSDDR